MTCREVGSCGVALLLVLGGLAPSTRAAAQTAYKPCSLVSVGETEAVAGEKVVKSVEGTVPHETGDGYEGDDVISACQRPLARGRTFLLTVGVPATEGTRVVSAGDVLRRQAHERVRKTRGTWESRQFGEITCTAVVVPSNPGLGATTCAAVTYPLYYGDGFDGTASVVREPLLFTLRFMAGPEGTVSMDGVHALAEKVLARMP